MSDAYTPTRRGYNTCLGYYCGSEEHFTHIKSSKGVNGTMLNFYDLANSTKETIAPQTTAVGVKDAPGTAFGNGTYSVYLYGNESVRLIKAHAAENSGRPLYMYLAWNVVHGPNEAPPNYDSPMITAYELLLITMSHVKSRQPMTRCVNFAAA